jgi:hypothetical protein
VTSRFRPRLLALQGGLGPDGEPTIDGLPWTSPEALARVREAAGPSVELVRFGGADRGQRHDVLPLTVVTEAMVAAVGVDRRRFRPNVVVAGAEGLAEVGWPGYGLRAGEALIGLRNRRARCVMTTFDPDTIEQDVDVFRRIYRDFGGEVALDSWVVEPGRVAEGDAVELVELDPAVVPPPGHDGEPIAWRRGTLA